MKAVVGQSGEKEGTIAVEEKPIPKLEPGEVLVKVKAASLNPTDWKHAYNLKYPGCISGCDYAGVVEEVSEGVSDWKKGDRIAGATHGGIHPDRGSFAEYARVDPALALRIPSNWTDEQAATLGVSVTTVAQGLYQSLKLPLPENPAKDPIPVLIWAGSTATGIMAIQYAKLSNLTVFTTSSPKNFDYLKSLGADHTFDYRDPNVSKEIKSISKSKIKHVFDCISEGDSTKKCVDALSDDGGTYSCLLPVKKEGLREDVTYNHTLAYTAYGKPFTYAKKIDYPAKPEDHEFAAKFWKNAEIYLETDKIKSSKIRVLEKLESVEKGFEEMIAGKVSAEKIVFKFA